MLPAEAQPVVDRPKLRTVGYFGDVGVMFTKGHIGFGPWLFCPRFGDDIDNTCFGISTVQD